MPRIEIFPTRIDFDFKNFEVNRSDLELDFEIGLSNRTDIISTRLDFRIELFSKKDTIYLYLYKMVNRKA